jgi:hypothetical protein
MTDLTGNVSATVTEDGLADGEGVKLDFTAPVITITGETDSLGRYIGGAPSTFNEGTCIVTNASSETNEIESGGVIYDEGTYTATVTDPAGNFTTGTFTVSYGSIVLSRDIGDLEITYAEGDSESNVTRDITLPLLCASGADVSWAVALGDAVFLSGIDSETGDAYTGRDPAGLRRRRCDGGAHGHDHDRRRDRCEDLHPDGQGGADNSGASAMCRTTPKTP